MDCEKIHFAEAAESAELRYILSEMAKYPECDFSDFRRVYGSEQKLRCYAKNQKVREKFDLIDPDFSDSVVFGLYSLFSEKNKIEQARCAAGGMAKSVIKRLFATNMRFCVKKGKFCQTDKRRILFIPAWQNVSKIAC